VDEALRRAEQAARENPGSYESSLRLWAERRRGEGAEGTLHVAQTESVAGVLKEALSSGSVLPWPGDFIPLPWLEAEPVGAWIDQAADAVVTRSPWRCLKDGRQRNAVLRPLRRDLATRLFDFAEDALQHRRLVLWVGPTLDDQAFFVWACSAIQRLLQGVHQPEILIQPTYAHRPELRLGEHDTDDFRHVVSHAPLVVRESDRALIARAWRGLVASSPQPFLELLPELTTHLPQLALAAQHLRDRYPERRVGLNAQEWRLLDMCREFSGSDLRRALGEACAYSGLHDPWRVHGLHAAALRLAGGERPLLELAGGPRVRQGFPDPEGQRVRITRDGARVLAGEANAIDLIGYDAWVFGVHLDAAKGELWCHDEGELVLTKR